MDGAERLRHGRIALACLFSYLGEREGGQVALDDLPVLDGDVIGEIRGVERAILRDEQDLPKVVTE